ncbi:MAG TPA: AMP-binding protein [Micromonosporaceae bacterium]
MNLVNRGARLVDGTSGDVVAGAHLESTVAAGATEYHGLPDGVVFARTGLTVAAVLRYLGAWSAGRPVALLDPALDPATLAELVRRYRPAAVVGLGEGGAGASPGDVPHGYTERRLDVLGPAWVRSTPDRVPAVHPDLGVLLATSGSTGSPKLVRLSRRAVHANATAIAEALVIDSDEIAPTSLPLFYSYGLSVLNSHLVAGATVLVADGGVLSREFWTAFDAHGATSLAGVPYHYEMLARIRWSPVKHPSLRMLTQAGGRLRPELIAEFHEKISSAGGRMVPMYGQTEATARITVLPPGRLPGKLGSPGIALPGGRLSVVTDDGTETVVPGVTGEIVYRGPNVMMGYAEDATDLARGDDLGGVLRTGDLGYLDDEGFLFLTGRLKRIGKVFGVRVNLDDIEKLLRDSDLDLPGPVAAVPAGEKVAVWCEGDYDDAARAELGKVLSERLKMHRSGFEVRAVERLPLLSSGKIDYRALEARA